MFDVLHTRNSSYSSSLLCFIIVCILVVCAVNERPELDKLSYASSNNDSAIASPGNEFYDFVFVEIKNYSEIKSIVSKRPAVGKTIGSRGNLTYAVIGDLFILINACTHLLLYFYRELTTSHHFIITYIHNLDGMKP